MKSLHLLACLIVTTFCYCQKYYVPYRINNGYGLADENGKLVIDTKYNDIEYIADDYFVYSTTTKVKENGYEYDKQLFGLLKGKTELISNADNENFLIYKGLIINSNSPYFGEYCKLYNTKGELIFPEEIYNLRVNDSYVTGDLDSYNSRYHLIMIMGAKNYKSVQSLFVYDNEKQVITKWLLKDVNEYKVINPDKNNFIIHYKDNTGDHEKRIAYTNGTFDIIDVKKIVEENSVTEYKDLPSIARYSDSSDDNFSNIEIITKGSKFTLVNDKKESNIVYDSIFYFGNNFIVGKKAGNDIKYGIINSNGKELLPIVYDSISNLYQCKMIEIRYGEYKLKFAPEEVHDIAPAWDETESRTSYYRYASDYIQVYKGDKTGLFTHSMEVLIPVEYEMIAENKLPIYHPKIYRYILLKKNGKYGLTFLEPDSSNKLKMTNTVSPAFDHIPAYYHKDYFGIQGLRMFVLCNNDATYAGYATEKGKKYFEDSNRK